MEKEISLNGEVRVLGGFGNKQAISAGISFITTSLKKAFCWTVVVLYLSSCHPDENGYSFCMVVLFLFLSHSSIEENIFQMLSASAALSHMSHNTSQITYHNEKIPYGICGSSHPGLYSTCFIHT